MERTVKIACVGLNVVDCYEHQGLAYPGGNEFNVSIFARRLKADSAFIGCFGDDFYSGVNYATALQEGVDLSRCRFYSGEVCGMAAVTLLDGDRVFAGGNDGGVTGRHPVHLEPEDLAYLREFDLAVSDRYSRMPAREFEALHTAGLPLAFDFGDEALDEFTWRVLPLCRYAFFSSAGRTNQEVCRLLEDACRRGCSCAVATLGGKGAAALVNGQREPVFVPAPETAVVDTMGAGDSFLTAFLLRACSCGQLTPQALTGAMRAGAAFASRNCTFYGSVGNAVPYPVGAGCGSIIRKQKTFEGTEGDMR